MIPVDDLSEAAAGIFAYGGATDMTMMPRARRAE
jgi:hypothetical protein